MVDSLTQQIMANPVIERRWKALHLLMSGFSLREICMNRKLDYGAIAEVEADIEEILGTILAPDVEKYRRLEGMRLNALQVAIWDDAVEGKHRAIVMVLRIMEQRAKLFGLNAPTLIETKGMNLSKIIIHIEGDASDKRDSLLDTQGTLGSAERDTACLSP